MLRNNSLKLRYLISFWVILVPVVLFLTILNHVSTDNNRRYINQVSLDRFTYATENLVTLLERFDYAASTALALESSIVSDEKGDASVTHPYQAIAALERLQDSLASDVHVFLYLRGDKYIYTSTDRLLYGEFEASMTDRYALSLSGLYQKMMTTASTKELKAIVSREGRTGALAYIIPFPVEPLPAKAMLVFLIPTETLLGEFENYLGTMTGDLFLYDAFFRQVYTAYAGDAEMIPFDQLVRMKGVGVQEVDDRHMRMTVAHPGRGLNCMLVMERGAFYSDMQDVQQHMLMLDILLIVLLVVMFVWLALFNYRPVRQLVTDVVGKPAGMLQTNELELVRNYYQRTVDELESLNVQILEMMPMITQQLVMKLVHGQIQQYAQLEALGRYAGIELNRAWFTALYVLAQDDAGLEMALQKLLRFQRPQVGMLTGEMTDESALCVVLNYDVADADADADASQQEAMQIAEELLKQLDGDVRIGVGIAYRDALRMVDSFTEASAAAHMPTQGQHCVCRYKPHAEKTDGEGYTGLSPLAVSLLNESVTRGETAIACRALTEMVDSLNRTTDSMIFFRFYCTELINQLLRLADELHISVHQKQMEELISCQSRHEFTQAALQFIHTLCDEARRRNEETSLAEKDRLLAYILEHYKEFDLSVQSVADALALRRGEVAAIIRENMGLNFVQYISGLRMNEFKRLLVDTDQTITELVGEVGYSDVSNFLRKFKTAEGVTAGQYRTEHRR